MIRFTTPGQNWLFGRPVRSGSPAAAAIQRAIAAGAQCIEHGHLMDAETAARMAEKDIWLSTQPLR